MKDKFKMPLTWHNCYSYPPEESYNDNLIATDGYFIFPVEYHKISGWWNSETKTSFTLQELKDYYWADLEQTVRGCSEFEEDNNND